MKLKWTLIVRLNQVLCNLFEQPHAVRYQPPVDKDGNVDYPNVEELSRRCANDHWFMEGNKRTAVCILVATTLKDL